MCPAIVLRLGFGCVAHFNVQNNIEQFFITKNLVLYRSVELHTYWDGG